MSDAKQPVTLVIDSSNQLIYSGGFIGDTAYVREIELKAGAENPAHAHWIPHVGNSLSGHAVVPWFDLDTREFGVYDIRVPAKIEIPRHRLHQVIAITDIRWECWFYRAEAERIYGDEAPKVEWWMDKPLGREYDEALVMFGRVLEEIRTEYRVAQISKLQQETAWLDAEKRDLWQRMVALGYRGLRG